MDDKRLRGKKLEFWDDVIYGWRLTLYKFVGGPRWLLEFQTFIHLSQAILSLVLRHSFSQPICHRSRNLQTLCTVMGSLWHGKTYPKNTASLLDRTYVNREDLDLSKEVLQVSVGQRTAKLKAVKVRDLKKILPLGRSGTKCGQPRFKSQTMGSSSKFESLQLCSPLTYRDSQYLFWKM